MESLSAPSGIPRNGGTGPGRGGLSGTHELRKEDVWRGEQRRFAGPPPPRWPTSSPFAQKPVIPNPALRDEGSTRAASFTRRADTPPRRLRLRPKPTREGTTKHAKAAKCVWVRPGAGGWRGQQLLWSARGKRSATPLFTKGTSAARPRPGTTVRGGRRLAALVVLRKAKRCRASLATAPKTPSDRHPHSLSARHSRWSCVFRAREGIGFQGSVGRLLIILFQRS